MLTRFVLGVCCPYTSSDEASPTPADLAATTRTGDETQMATADKKERIVREVRENISVELGDWIEDQFADGSAIDEVWAMLEAARDEIKTQVRPS